jgi:hypothetical protein
MIQMKLHELKTGIKQRQKKRGRGDEGRYKTKQKKRKCNKTLRKKREKG